MKQLIAVAVVMAFAPMPASALSTFEGEVWINFDADNPRVALTLEAIESVDSEVVTQGAATADMSLTGGSSIGGFLLARISGSRPSPEDFVNIKYFIDVTITAKGYSFEPEFSNYRWFSDARLFVDATSAPGFGKSDVQVSISEVETTGDFFSSEPLSLSTTDAEGSKTLVSLGPGGGSNELLDGDEIEVYTFRVSLEGSTPKVPLPGAGALMVLAIGAFGAMRYRGKVRSQLRSDGIA